jgi:predicted nucleic acid-binding protein
MIQIGLDTSVLIGLLDPKDTWHVRATTLMRILQEQDALVAAFDCVLAEAISTMARRIHEQRRIADLDQLLARLVDTFPSEQTLWILPDVPALYNEIVEMVRTTGGALNFNDALIALACRNRSIPLLASFDRDFDRISWMQRVSQPGDLPPVDGSRPQ